MGALSEHCTRLEHLSDPESHNFAVLKYEFRPAEFNHDAHRDGGALDQCLRILLFDMFDGFIDPRPEDVLEPRILMHCLHLLPDVFLYYHIVVLVELESLHCAASVVVLVLA